MSLLKSEVLASSSRVASWPVTTQMFIPNRCASLVIGACSRSSAMPATGSSPSRCNGITIESGTKGSLVRSTWDDCILAMARRPSHRLMPEGRARMVLPNACRSNWLCVCRRRPHRLMLVRHGLCG